MPNTERARNTHHTLLERACVRARMLLACTTSESAPASSDARVCECVCVSV